MPVIFLIIALFLLSGCAGKSKMNSGTGSQTELESARRAAENAELEASELRKELRLKSGKR